MSAAAWRASAPLILDGLAWGLDPSQTLALLAERPAHAHLRSIVAATRAGRPLAEALEARGAPAEVIDAVRVGRAVDAHASAGLRARIAMRGRAEGRLALLTGLALPLGSLVVAMSVIDRTAALMQGSPMGRLPGWIEAAVSGALALALVIALAIALPGFGRTLARLPGLGWIGRRRQASQLADLLALTLQADGDVAQAAADLGQPRVARALRAGETLSAALARSATGRALTPYLDGVGPARWSAALQDAAGDLRVGAMDRTAAWSAILRVGGTVVAAALIGAWLVWIYGAIAVMPQGMPA